MRKKKSTIGYSEFTKKSKKSKEFLSTTSINLTINDKGSFCNPKGTEISNFFILPISVCSQYAPNGQKEDDIYTFEILNSSHCAKITISLAELSHHKWIKNVGGCFFLRKSTDYPCILSILDAMSDLYRDSSPFFASTGFHKIGNRWCYVTCNLTIHSDKLDWGQHMLHEDCHACQTDCSQCRYRLNSSLEKMAEPDTDKIQDIITPLITELQKNIKTALPIFMMPLLSSITSVFSSEGISSTPLNLWITGEPGSGKTQLALYLGSFYNKPEKRNDSMFARNYLRANTSTKLLQERIKKNRDNTILLDDVKAENSTSLREHTNTNIETLIRSIFDHNLSGIPVYSSAIITGEYRPNIDSTLGRLILLPLKNFQEVPENLETLSFFQSNGHLLTDFMILFLQWACQKLENTSFLPTLQSEKARLTDCFINDGFSTRSSEILTTLRLGLHLLENFCCEHTLPSFKETIRSLVADGEVGFKELVRHTAYLHENSSILYARVLSNLILKDETIRSAPEVFYMNQLNYFNYCVSPTENGIFIKYPAVFLHKSNPKDSLRCQPCLLVRKELLEELPYELEDYCIRHGIPSTIYRKFNLRYLADHGFILVSYNRSDNYVNNVVTYPCADITEGNITLENFYRINLNHSLLKHLEKELSERESQPSSVFHEMSENGFIYEYGYDSEIYDNCERRNFHCYIGCSNQYDLNKFEKDFQNIFDYFHLKD